MRTTPDTPLVPSTGSALLVLVFLAGMAMGAKMAGAW